MIWHQQATGLQHISDTRKNNDKILKFTDYINSSAKSSSLPQLNEHRKNTPISQNYRFFRLIFFHLGWRAEKSGIYDVIESLLFTNECYHSLLSLWPKFKSSLPSRRSHNFPIRPRGWSFQIVAFRRS